jgi:hypothetical protein
MLLKLLSLPVTLPASGIRYCLDRLVDVAEAEVNSEDPIKEELLELQLELEEGLIDEDAYRGREAVLLARLRDVRARSKAAAREAAPDGSSGRVVIELPAELE